MEIKSIDDLIEYLKINYERLLKNKKVLNSGILSTNNTFPNRLYVRSNIVEELLKFNQEILGKAKELKANMQLEQKIHAHEEADGD